MKYKKVSNYENYFVYEDGRVFSTYLNDFLKPTIDADGYYKVRLYNNGKQKQFLISRLVAKAFIPNPNKFPMVNHINLDRLDNRVSNLEWINNIGNINHAIENGVQMGKPKKV